MRWDRLWSDLEAQADALDRDEFDAEVVDRSIRERAAVTLMDRVRASVGAAVRCETAGGRRWRGRLVAHGADWVAIRVDTVGDHVVLVPVGAIRSVVGLSAQAVPVEATGLLARRLDLRLLLRRLMIAHAQVQVSLTQGEALSGRFAAVGSDYLDIRDPGGEVWSVPLASVASVAAS